MSRLLLILIIAAVVFWWYRRHRIGPPATSADSDDRETTMVRCAQCDLYLPPANASLRDGHWYCERHR